METRVIRWHVRDDSVTNSWSDESGVIPSVISLDDFQEDAVLTDSGPDAIRTGPVSDSLQP